MQSPLRICTLLALAFWLVANASAQVFQSPSIHRMTAAYDPTAQAVVLAGEQGRRMVDPAVRPAAVYQPPGRVYGVQDPYAVSGPGVVTPPSPGVVGAPGVTYGQPAIQQPAFQQPGLQQPGVTYGAPIYTEPLSPSAGVYVPTDPYACGPAYTHPQAVPGTTLGPAYGAALRPAHTEIEGRMGDPAEVLQGNLMLPFWQQQNVFWFFDLRGQYDDERAGEGNFGIARRQLLTSGHIVSLYAFYDIRHSAFNNNFQQGMVGFELLTLDWEYRVNGYLPFTGTQTTGLNVASLDVNNNIVVQQGLERAYFGFDAEFGWLLSRLGGIYDHEVRGFLGGYYFDTSKAGFPSIGGPRARLEGRLYDLPALGGGSRFTYGLSYQWDDGRQSQWIASVNLRIPFGRGQSAATKLSPIERRMLSSLRRDEAIVTGGALSGAEQAVITSTGQVASNVTVIDNGATAVADVAAGGDIVVVTADIDIAATGPIGLGPNQFIGGQFGVQGQNTGAQATFGRKHTITGAAANNVLQLADNATITGLNITGGDSGIGGNNATGFTITNNTISGAATAAITLQNLTGGVIVGNTLTGGGATPDGIVASTLLGATEVRDNTISGFTADGLRVAIVNGGQYSGNRAVDNGQDGLQFGLVNGGVFSNNHAEGNDDDGFEIATLAGGTFSNNIARTNGDAGFDFIAAVTSGNITGNLAQGNTDSGFDFTSITGGTVRMNRSLGNMVDGYQITTLNGGDVQFSLAEDNTNDGFQVNSFLAGTFSNNTANNNTAQGYNVTGAGGTAANNAGDGNGSNDTHP